MRKTIEANVWVKIFHGDLLQVSDEVYKQNIASNKLLAKLLCVKCLTKTLSCIAAFKFHKDEHKIRLALPLGIDRLSLNSSVICNCPLHYYQQSTSLLVLSLLTFTDFVKLDFQGIHVILTNLIHGVKCFEFGYPKYLQFDRPFDITSRISYGTQNARSIVFLISSFLLIGMVLCSWPVET